MTQIQAPSVANVNDWLGTGGLGVYAVAAVVIVVAVSVYVFRRR